MDPAATEYTKILKEISDIKFVLSLMMKHGSTSVPTDELKKISDFNILLLCEYNKEFLLGLLVDREKRSTIVLSQGTSSGKFISVFLHH